MASPVTFRLRWQNPSVLRRYADLSRHTPAEVCNKKAYHILRKAIWFTEKANYDKMRDSLGQYKRMDWKLIKSGRRYSFDKRNIKSFFARGAAKKTAPMLALLIQARVFGTEKTKKSLAQSPWKGVPRAEGARRMLEAMRKVWKAKTRSIAFIKSGWITARDIYKQWGAGAHGLPPSEPSSIGGPKTIGAPKGGAEPATAGLWKCTAKFWNTASTKRETKQALIKYGQPALEQAFREEETDTMAEVARRLKEHAHTCGIRSP